MTKKERAAHKQKMDRIHAETLEIVKTGCCPVCGRALKQNLSITGWWQCSQFGAVTRRADPTQPSCNWQGFTE